MRILRPSPRFYAAMLALASSIPLVATELFLMRKGMGLPNPVRLSIWCSFALLLSFVLAFLSWRIQKPAVTALLLVGTAWFFQAISSAWRLNSVPLAWFAFAVAAAMGTAVVLMTIEFASSSYDPGMNWYEGAPQPIPGVHCELEDGRAVKISRIDDRGVFVFCENREALFGASDKIANTETELRFAFRGKKLACKALAVSALRTGAGAGFSFRGLSSDTRKELGDLIETLRGEGYV